MSGFSKVVVRRLLRAHSAHEVFSSVPSNPLGSFSGRLTTQVRYPWLLVTYPATFKQLSASLCIPHVHLASIPAHTQRGCVVYTCP